MTEFNYWKKIYPWLILSYNFQAYGKYMHPSLRPPFKSYEYESLDDGLKRSELDVSDYAMAGGALRETAINSVLDSDPYYSDR